jgi:hypothetical protein
MNRRTLISGAAAFAVLKANRHADAQSCPPPVVGPTHLPPTQVCVGNTEFALPDDFATDTQNNSLNSRKLCYAPALSDITDIVLAFPGFGLNNPEQNLPGAYTVTASVEYPLGTPPHQVFFGGAGSATVASGRTLLRTDPLPITIPAGAGFAVKTYATWTVAAFWMSTLNASAMLGEWTARGVGLSDHTLDNQSLATTSNAAGFAPIVYATLNTPTAVVGLVGDSWGAITSDWLNPTIGYNGWGRAMRGAIPFINLARSGDSAANYFGRPEGRNLVLRNGITHCIWEMGGNDLFGGASIATLIGNLESAINPFLDRGIKCYAMTLTPRSTSTDGFITAQNQTIVSAAVENVRVPYNAWLRGGFASIGLSGVFDVAHAIDPTDSGLWGFDPQASRAVANSCSGFATLANGAVASVANAAYTWNSSAGGPYPPGGVSIPCVVYAYPNSGGAGAQVNAVTDATNPWVASYTVVNGGSGYTYPPMISTAGCWTPDGVHPNSRGWNEVLNACGNIAPETFVL